MDPLNGIELARALEPEHLPSLVFVTAYDAYALEAFEVCAVDYLLKPFDQERFRKTLAGCARSISRAMRTSARRCSPDCSRSSSADARAAPEERPRLLAEFNGQLHVIDVKPQVEMIEADRNYVTIRVGRDSFHARSTLSQAEQALDATHAADQPLLPRQHELRTRGEPHACAATSSWCWPAAPR
jgi:two-component system LytT family response regulator